MLSKEEIKEYKTAWEKRKIEKERKYHKKKEEGRQKAFKISQFLKSNYGINTVILFGSLSNKSDCLIHEHTDIDIAFDDQNINYFEIIDKAADIATPFKLDLLPLTKASPSLKKRIKYYGEEL